MELKDLILETINELSPPSDPLAPSTSQVQLISSHDVQAAQALAPEAGAPRQSHTSHVSHVSHVSKEALREECEFLEMLQERLLVLFDGLNAPQNKNTPERLNITINFLEYQLSVIQERLNDLKK